MENEKNKQLASIASCGVEFISAVAVGILVGVWLDGRFDKSPLFLVLFFLLGCVSGYFNVLKHLEKQKK